MTVSRGQEPQGTADGGSAQAMLRQVAQARRLDGPDGKPWHLKASFKVVYQPGGVKDEGTYEEFWVSRTKYKSIYKSTLFSRTEYGTEHLPLVTGNRSGFPYPLGKMRGLIVSPLPNERFLPQYHVNFNKREIDGETRECFELTLLRSGGVSSPPASFCFDASKNLIAEVSGPEERNRVSFRNPLEFDGREVQRDIDNTDAISEGVVTLSVHVEGLEPLAPQDGAFFQPPADAQPPEIRMIQRRTASTPGTFQGEVNISAGVAQGLLLSKVAPVYPPVAKAAKVSGTVVLEATISKEGKIVDLHVVSGPPLLQRAAMDAVQQWTYRPYMLNGEPVEVLATVNVVFTLGAQNPAAPQPPQ